MVDYTGTRSRSRLRRVRGVAFHIADPAEPRLNTRRAWQMPIRKSGPTVKSPGNVKKPANLFAPKFQRKGLKIKRLASFFAIIRSNLCTRHIQKKLTPRGHHDWPDKRPMLIFGINLMPHQLRTT
jgi:hypothetical protein